MSLLATPRRRRAVFALGLAAVALLPVAGRLLRGRDDARCTWDGVAVDARFEARLVRADGEGERFCCLCCLARRLATLDAPARRVVVADEVSAAEVDADAAWYVDSAVVTNRSTGCRVHAFADEAAAARHAAAFHGTARGRGLAALTEDAQGGR